MELAVIMFCAMVAILFLTLVFLIAKARDRYDLIDVAWGLAFIVIAVTSYIFQPHIQLFSIQTLTTFLVTVWGLRLSSHIYTRWSRSDTEDARYQAMRGQYAKKPGGVAINMYFRVFLVQAILAVVVSIAVIIVNMSESVGLNWLAGVGLTVWLIGFIFETVGDEQLKEHLATGGKKAGIMTTGLWRYTRHPNYFGEATQWWGIWVIALSVPLGWIGVISPLVITVLLLFISGVPLTEKRFEGRKGWAEYKRTTSIFIPLLSKK